MKKRLVIIGLWFYAGWYGAAIVAAFTGLPEAIGPIAGAVVAAIVAAPKGRLPAIRRQARTTA